MSVPALNRVVRRETHSPRTVAMFVAVVLLVVALLYVGVELVLSAAEQPALLISPSAGLEWLVALPDAEPQGAVIGGGIVLALIGLLFVVLALSPGRLSKHELEWDGTAVVADNGVLAASLAQHLSAETGIDRDAIVVGVAHRSVDVVVRAAPGIPVDLDEVRRIADAEVASYRLRPSVKTRARIVPVAERSLDA